MGITHVQLPQQQLNLVSVLEVGAVFLVQVRVHLAEQLLGILHVFVELGETRGPHHGQESARMPGAHPGGDLKPTLRWGWASHSP